MHRFAAVFGLLLGAALLQPTFASAQNLIDPGAEFLKEQERQRARERLGRATPGQTLKTEPPKPFVKEAVCFDIRKIKVRGVTVLNNGRLHALIKAYSGTCMGQKAIEALRQQITNAYIEAGFITTRANVPKQDVANKVLILDVVEGRIEGFSYKVVHGEGEAVDGPARKITSAFPAKPGDILQLRELEQGLEQINRLASSRASINLIPGKEPGTSIVVVSEIKEDVLRGRVSFDNNGSQDTGQERIRASVELDDVLSLNETYSVSYVGTENTNALSYSFSIPFQNWLFSTYGSYSETLSAVAPTADLFSQTGNISIHVERLLARDAKRKFHIYGSGGYYWNSRFINVAKLIPQNRTSVRLGVRQEHYFPGSVLSIDTALAFGVPLLGADQDLPDPADDTPLARFSKVDARVSFIKALEKGAQYYATATGQYSPSPLFSNEQLTVGGWDTVRGYSGLGVTGEQGVYTRHELSLPMPDWPASTGLHADGVDPVRETYMKHKDGIRPFVFADAGFVRNLALDRSFNLLGAGVGIRGSIGPFSFDTALAFPILESAIAEFGNLQGLVNVTYKIF